MIVVSFADNNSARLDMTLYQSAFEEPFLAATTAYYESKEFASVGNRSEYALQVSHKEKFGKEPQVNLHLIGQGYLRNGETPSG
jgi:hypothetical protein